MEKLKIHYSSSREIKNYLESIAERYNMTISGVLTMIIMQHKLQNETLQKFDDIQEMLSKIDTLKEVPMEIKTFSSEYSL